MSAIDDILAYTAQNDWVPYYAGGGDNDRDGTPDRADIGDGNGVDCSGWVWLVLSHLATLGYFTGTAHVSLGSTSSYSAMARDRGWIAAGPHPLAYNEAAPGDILIHATNGDPYHSDGPVGHTGILIDKSNGLWRTSESASSKSGVGIYTRPPSFWCLAIRVPGMTIGQNEDDMTPDQARQLAHIEQMLGDGAAPGVLHDVNAMLHRVFDINPADGNSGLAARVAGIEKLLGSFRDGITGVASTRPGDTLSMLKDGASELVAAARKTLG